jgi:hypothetical protein
MREPLRGAPAPAGPAASTGSINDASLAAGPPRGEAGAPQLLPAGEVEVAASGEEYLFPSWWFVVLMLPMVPFHLFNAALWDFVFPLTARTRPGWLSALSVSHSKSVFYGAFLWARSPGA